MLNDSEHFNSLKPPLAPNDDEVEIYKSYIEGKTLLLGYTKELIDLCDNAFDLNPPLNSKVVKQDWFTIDEHYNTIIGDGVLNLVSGDLVEYLSKYCDQLIIRFFTEKIDGMKYATNFRNNTPFLLPDKIIETQPKCKILIWKFKN